MRYFTRNAKVRVILINGLPVVARKMSRKTGPFVGLL
jgi:hypothetical protein